MGDNEQKPVVLLIDDAPAIHRLLTFKLKDDGLEFLTAYSGREGMELAREHLPSLILVDLNMPGQNGLEVIHQLKQDSATSQIPVIVVSGSVESEEKVRAIDAGAMDFVTKPFDIHELRARIGSALRIHRLMRMLEQRAQIDGMTELWNRTHFNDRLEAELNSVARRGGMMAMAMCDLDHFKELNDTFGHQAGDAVLQRFAKMVMEEVRSCDVACRFGGEEFALILPDATEEAAVAVCERIRRRLESKAWPAYPEMKTTVSFGVTTSGIDGSWEPGAWIAAADEALYRAKGSGRNAVVVHRADGPTQGSHLRRAG